MAISNGKPSYPFSVIVPFTEAPGENSPASFTPNQAPNSSASVSARQTGARGMRRRIFSSMRSVFIGLILDLPLSVSWSQSIGRLRYA